VHSSDVMSKEKASSTCDNNGSIGDGLGAVN
jgi:hypothetical protein